MIKKIIVSSIALCLSGIIFVFAQQDDQKPKKSKQKKAIENKECEPALKADTAAIDLRTGKPNNAPTDTTSYFKNK